MNLHFVLCTQTLVWRTTFMLVTRSARRQVSAWVIAGHLSLVVGHAATTVIGANSLGAVPGIGIGEDHHCVPGTVLGSLLKVAWPRVLDAALGNDMCLHRILSVVRCRTPTLLKGR